MLLQAKNLAQEYSRYQALWFSFFAIYLIEEDNWDDETIPELMSRTESTAEEEKVTQDKANMTIAYYDDDDELCDEGNSEIDEEVEIGINNKIEIDFNNIEIGINEKGDLGGEHLDNDSEDDSLPRLMNRDDGCDSSDDDSDDDSTPGLIPRDDRYEDWDSDDSTVGSIDERIQSKDIPRSVTDMMVAEQKRRENVTTYVVMSLLNKNGAQDTGAHQDDLMLDSGANIHCSPTTAGM